MKPVLVNLVRIVFLGAALGYLAPLLPGIGFSGSVLGAFLMGAGLWAAYKLAQLVVRKRTGVGPGAACPMPAMQKKLLVLYVALSIVYVGVLGLVPGALAITNAPAAIISGVIAFVAAVASNVVTRLISREGAGGF